MLPHDPSSLFPVFYRKLTDIRVVSPLVHRGFLSTRKTLAWRLREQSSEIVGWENFEQSGLQLVLGIYLLRRWIAMPQIGAALWI
jgi:hypothetical protein